MSNNKQSAKSATKGTPNARKGRELKTGGKRPRTKGLGFAFGVLKRKKVEDAPSEQEYLVVTPLFEEGYGQPTTNFFRVVATSDVEATCKATDITGSEEWWEQVHGDDLDAREDTLVGESTVLKMTMEDPKPPLFRGRSLRLVIDNVPSSAHSKEAAQ